MKTRENLIAEENKNSEEFYPKGIDHDKTDKISEEMGINEEDTQIAHDKWVNEVEEFENNKNYEISQIGIKLEKELTKRELAFMITQLTIKLYKMKSTLERYSILSKLMSIN